MLTGIEEVAEAFSLCPVVDPCLSSVENVKSASEVGTGEAELMVWVTTTVPLEEVVGLAEDVWIRVCSGSENVFRSRSSLVLVVVLAAELGLWSAKSVSLQGLTEFHLPR